MFTWRRVPAAVPFLCVALAVRTGAAQEHPIALTWQAPDMCPSSAAVLQEVDRLLGGRPQAGGMQRLVARAQVTRASDGRFALTLRTETRDATGERALSAPTCEALAGAAALVIALGFDPAAVTSVPAETPTAGPPSPPPAAPAAAPPLPAAPAAAPPLPAAPAAAPPLPAAPAAAPPLPAAPAAAPPPPTAPPAPALPTPVASARVGAAAGPALPPTSPAPFGLGAGVGLGLDVGAFDGPAPVVRAWATLLVARLRFDAALSYVPTTSIAVPERPAAGGRFTLLAGAASACFTLRSWTAATTAACAGLELGQISAEGYGVSRPREGHALWIAPQAKLDLTLRLAPPLALRLDAGVEVPLGRRPFVLENVGVVHEPSPLAGRAGLGAEVHF
ncbi:hypothetical protein [Sorangium sp. So ce1389]|uniref:hypothetical protein n=1 Tax=Sorangium sp. So ce1389 TaxID=3133336 RepID=UPI003F619A95